MLMPFGSMASPLNCRSQASLPHGGAAVAPGASSSSGMRHPKGSDYPYTCFDQAGRRTAAAESLLGLPRAWTERVEGLHRGHEKLVPEGDHSLEVMSAMLFAHLTFVTFFLLSLIFALICTT